MNREKLKAWIQSSRAPFFVATLVPLTFGAVIAHAEGSWNATVWIAALVASFLVHLNTNLANDYFEYFSGADEGESIGGSRVLQEGKLTPTEIRNAMILFYGIAGLIGVWIVCVSGVEWLLGVVVFAFFSSVFYTAPPIRYGYLGLGEVFVGVNMGPIMVTGTVAALSGRFIPEALWLSIPVGLMVAMILFYQSLPDIDDDRAVGKRTIAVRLGRPTAIWGIRFFVAAVLISIAVLVLSGYLHPVALASLLTLPLGFMIDRMIRLTDDWKDLHDRGGVVRLFYLVNGLILIFTVAVFG